MHRRDGGRSEQYLNEPARCETKYVVRARRSSQFARLAVVLLTVAAWFVASDHCALAGVLLQPVAASSAHESCPGHSQPEKKPGQEKLPCCKSLSAHLAPAKISASYDVSAFLVQSYFSGEFPLFSSHSNALIAELDTGPPEVLTFAESVLQRSVLAHAPPRFA